MQQTCSYLVRVCAAGLSIWFRPYVYIMYVYIYIYIYLYPKNGCFVPCRPLMRCGPGGPGGAQCLTPQDYYGTHVPTDW